LYVHKQTAALAADTTLQYLDYKDNMFQFYVEFTVDQVRLALLLLVP